MVSHVSGLLLKEKHLLVSTVLAKFGTSNCFCAWSNVSYLYEADDVKLLILSLRRFGRRARPHIA